MTKLESKSVAMFRLIEELESSGQDRQAFASLHGITLGKLAYWRGRYHRQNQNSSGFVELSGTPGDPGLEIAYPNGVTIRLPGDCGPARLRELVTLLQGPCFL